MTLRALPGKSLFRPAVGWAAAWVLMLASTAPQAAAPIAGSYLNNQASATYTDPLNVALPVVYSNLVEARVEQVGSFTLTSSQTRLAAPGQTTYFPHVLTNTGNGPDSFSLAVADGFAGSFNFSALNLYADADGDGRPDNNLPLATTGPLAPGAALRFVAAGAVPGAASVGQQDRLTVRAQGSAGGVPASAQVNTDTAIASNNAIVVAAKSFNVVSGPSPFNNGGAHTKVTITYTNTGNATASGVRVDDVIGGVGAAPAFNTSGMVYVPGSARWNDVPLTDAPGGDPAGTDYAANINGTTARLGLSIASLAPNNTQTLSFLVDIVAGLAAGIAQTDNVARVGYFDGTTEQAVATNRASYDVVGAPASPDLVLAKTPQGAPFTTGFNGAYSFAVRNNGNAASLGTISVIDTLPAGMTFVAAGSGGLGWVCAANGQTVVCTTQQVLAPQSAASLLNLVVAVSMPAAAATQPVANTASVVGGGESVGNSGNNASTASAMVGLPAAISGRVWLDSNHNHRFDAGETLLDGWRVEVLRMVNGNLVVVKSALSGIAGGQASMGAYMIDGLEPGDGYMVRFVDLASGVLYANPVDGEAGTPVSNATVDAGWLRNIKLTAGRTTPEQSLPLDPSGVVYDSKTRLPVSGARLTLTGPAGFDPDLHLLGGTGNLSQLTGAAGFYQYLLRPGAPAGVYRLEVVAPSGYLVFSAAGLLPASISRGACPVSVNHCLDPTGLGDASGALPVQPLPGPPAEGQPFPYYLAFNLQAGDPNVVNNHIPLDPLPPSAIFIQKTASRGTVELGDFVDYTVQVRNSTTAVVPGAVSLTDHLPAGFSYQAGSARRDGQALADPAGGAGPTLRFANLPPLGAGESYAISYRVRVGVGALQGDGINRAQASAGALSSMTAQARVVVQGGVFSDKAYIVGKVYVECHRDRVQNEQEIGIPGVRMYLEDGTFVVSDSEGKYSFYGVAPRSHVLKLDMTSMPAGSELVVLGNRNAGDAGSRFVDLKNGELHKANFAEGSCTPEILKAVFARRDKGAVFVAETDMQLAAKIPADGKAPTLGDVKALPAAGLLGGDPRVPSFTPVLPTAPLASSLSNLPPLVPLVPLAPLAPLVPLRSAAAVDLDQLMPELDNGPGFVLLKDADTLPYAQTQVLVKGPAGARLLLKVNGVELGPGRVGRKAVLADRKLEVWEYLGVDLKAGANSLELLALDPFGNLRGTQSISVIAPDKLGRLKLQLPAQAQAADGHTPAMIVVRLQDDAGLPVTVRTPVTLEASLGRWDVVDLDPKEPGVQVFIEGGQAGFALLPPQEPGDALVRVRSGLFKAEDTLVFAPDLRPLIGAGVIEGVLNRRSLASGSLMPARASDGFEQELRQLSRQSGDGKGDAGARAAFFLKGKVRGEYLLTLAFDSDKDTQERLFRDIQPDQFYPVYGDSAVKGFDAQSTGRLYVRIDHNKSYLLYGDYTTASASPVRQLGAYNRSLTGVKEHFENRNVAVNAFASRDSTRQGVEELPARGISGPYVIAGRELVANSEKIEILTRDRNQPGLVLKTVTLARFTDYDFESQTGRIVFRAAVPTLDANFNPNSIRITYEVAQGGDKFWVYGADGQAKVSENVELGGAIVQDDNPQDRTRLKSVNATVKLIEKTFLTAEVAQIERQSSGTGEARRIELRHEGDTLQARVYAGQSDTAFNNPAAPLSSGRDEAGAKLALRVGPKTAVKAEAIRSADKLSNTRREGVLAGVEHDLDDTFKVEAGARHSVDKTATAQTEVDSLRAKLTGKATPLLKLFGEYEQDVSDAAKRIAAIGGDYQLAQRTRLYGRHEFISSLGSAYALNETSRRNATVFGIDTETTEDGHLFSEYRLRDALSGREAEAAFGLRNKWRVADGLSVNTNLERIHALAGAGGDESLAVGAGVEYTADPLWKGSTRVEYRTSTASEQWLGTLGVANKLTRDWTVLGREVFTLNRNKGALPGEQMANRVQLGLAYRDTDTDRLNALARIEHKLERDSSNPAQALEHSATILSSHANLQHSKPLILSGRVAAKWATDRGNGLSSRYTLQAVGARATYDISWKWDAAVQASLLRGAGGAWQAGLGAEAGYLLANNLWLSAGYNLFGYTEPDLAGADYTSRGVFLRLRFKFDETLFGAGDARINNTLTPRP